MTCAGEYSHKCAYLRPVVPQSIRVTVLFLPASPRRAFLARIGRSCRSQRGTEASGAAAQYHRNGCELEQHYKPRGGRAYPRHLGASPPPAPATPRTCHVPKRSIDSGSTRPPSAAADLGSRPQTESASGRCSSGCGSRARWASPPRRRTEHCDSSHHTMQPRKKKYSPIKTSSMHLPPSNRRLWFRGHLSFAATIVGPAGRHAFVRAYIFRV